MRRRSLATRPLLLTLLGLLSVARPVVAADIKVEATVERNDVTAGEPFALTIAVNGAQNVEAPTLTGIDGVRADYLGPSTQVSFVNGQVSTSVSHRYRVVVDRPGPITLGPFSLDHRGQRYQTNAITLNVAAAAAGPAQHVVPPGGVQNLRLVVAPARTEAYVGERLDLTVTLYIGNIRVRELQYPTFSADGVTVDKFDKPEEGSEVINGRRYQTVRLRTTMTLLKPGPLDLSANMALSVLTNRRGNDPFFDSFFGGEAKPTEVRAEPVQITVLPLPDDGRPADFTGVVGHFDFALSAQPTELDAGDPVTLRMEITGDGNLASLSAPVVPVDDRFRRYEAQPVKGEDSAQKRVFEEVIIPNSPAADAVPAVRFSFFDPGLRAYQTITRGPIPLTVRAAAGGKPEVLDAAPGAPQAAREPERPLGRDLVFIKDAPGALQRRGAARQWLAWALLHVLPVLAFVGVAAYVRRRDRLAADPRLVRFRQAGTAARRALSELRGQATGDPQFYDALAGTLTAYLGAKLGLPPGALERERVVARLSANGCAAAVGEQAAQLFELIERARYAPSGDAAAERSTALALFGAIVDGLERERGLDRRLAAAVVLALLAGASAATQAEDGALQAAFFQGNQAYAAGQYGEAVRDYETALATGQESAALHFNLGNALFKSDQLGRAIASYERARRLAPRDPDIQANLAYARELAGASEAAAPLWKRLAFPFAHRAASDELGRLAIVCWIAFWGLLTARLLVPRAAIGFGRGALVAAVLYLAVAGSLGLRLAEVDLRQAVIVTAPGETAVRFEPSATGTQHFPVSAGTRLDVTEERNGWLQVRRDDGRRGWIPADTVEGI